jgi:hypothetical protein
MNHLSTYLHETAQQSEVPAAMSMSAYTLNLGGKGRRGPRDQAAGDLVRSRLSVSVDRGEKQLGRQAADGFQIHIHGRQGRPGLRGDLFPVVVPHDRDVSGDIASGLAEGIEGAPGDLVASAQDRVDFRVAGQQ